MCKLLDSWKYDAGIWPQIGRQYYVLVMGLSREPKTISSNTISYRANTVSPQPIWHKNDRPWTGTLYRTAAAIGEMLQLDSVHLQIQSANMRYRHLVLVSSPWIVRARGKDHSPHREAGHLGQGPAFTRQCLMVWIKLTIFRVITRSLKTIISTITTFE